MAGDATSIHPVVRQAAWSIMSSRNNTQRLRERVPGSAPCYNHHQRDEPGNWAEAFWGSNLPRLESIKAKYDPDNRFNCYHCVGHQDLEFSVPVLPSTSSDAFKGAQLGFRVLALAVAGTVMMLLQI